MLMDVHKSVDIEITVSMKTVQQFDGFDSGCVMGEQESIMLVGRPMCICQVYRRE